MSIKRALLISRPLYWFATVGYYLLGLQQIKNVSWYSGIELLFFLFPLNFFLYGLNDIYDNESDLLNPRKGDIQGAILTVKEKTKMKRIVYIPAIIFMVYSLFSGNLLHVISAFLFIFFNIAYSASGLRFKEIPFLDSITSAIIYSLPALIAYTTYHSTIESVPMPLLFFFAVPQIPLHALAALKDIEADEKAHMKTIGVFLKEEKTIIFSFLVFFISFIFVIPYLLYMWILLICCIWCFILLFTRIKYNDEFVFAVIAMMSMLWIFALFLYFLVKSFPTLPLF